MEADEGSMLDTEEKGNYGPYKQSLRKEIYQAYAKYLIEGKVYPCFCTPEDVETNKTKTRICKNKTWLLWSMGKMQKYKVEEAIEK